MPTTKLDDYIYDEDTGLDALEYDTVIGLDLETSGLSPWADKIAVVSMHGVDSGAIVILHVRGHISDEIVAFLSRPEVTFICHNGACFDMLFLANVGVNVEQGNYYDTLVGEASIVMTDRRNVRLSLQAALSRRLNIKITKGMGTSPWMAENLSPEQLKYCGEDIKFLGPLKDSQYKQGVEEKTLPSLEFEQRLVPVVTRMILTGLPFSEKALGEYRLEQEAVRAKYEEHIRNTFGVINLNSSVQVKKAFKNHLGIAIDSTDAATMMAMSDWDNEDVAYTAQAVLNHRMAAKRESMFSDEWLGKYLSSDGRIHGRLWQVGTDTGRFSSSDPNLQQIPRDARKLFGHVPGHSMFWADYCFHPDTLVETIDGVKRIADITPTDTVYSVRGEHVVTNKVVRSSPVQMLPAYELTFDNGKTAIASSDHRWPVRVGGINGFKVETELKTTEDLAIGERMTPLRRNIGGHGYVHMYTGSAFKYAKEHILAAEAALGPCPQGYEVHHKDENKANNKASNLEYLPSADHKRLHNTLVLAQRAKTHEQRVASTMKAVASRRSYKGNQNPNYGKYRRITVTCFMCASVFTRPASYSDGSPKYCSSACYNKARKQGLNHKLVSKKFIGLQPMHAIEVENDHNYALAVGVFTQNSALEVRVAAALAGDELMLKHLAEGDVHMTVAELITHKKAADITSEERKKAKAATFTLIFAGGAKGLVVYAKSKFGVDMELSEAKMIVHTFFAQYLGLARARTRAINLSNQPGALKLTLPSGLRRTLPPPLRPTQILNTMVQGTAAAGMKRAMIRASECEVGKYLGATVHDELVGCCPSGIAEEMQLMLEDCMIQGMRDIIDTDIKVHGQFGDFWLS